MIRPIPAAFRNVRRLHLRARARVPLLQCMAVGHRSMITSATKEMGATATSIIKPSAAAAIVSDMTTDNDHGEAVHYSNPEITRDEHQPGNTVDLPYGFRPLPSQARNKRIFYFDIDNCLYQRLTQIHDLMQVKIHQYFKDLLLLDDKCAHDLHMNYYKTYGLALEGLVRNHQVDALAYNAAVDDLIELKGVLTYNNELREMLQRIRGQFDYFWLVTNAYKNHAMRVVSFLGIGDLFDGLTFCDYAKDPIVCKPMPAYFYGALEVTRIDAKNQEAMQKQWFIDDSEINVKAAYDLGFGHVVHYVENPETYARLETELDYYGKNKIILINDILDLEKVI